MYYEKYFIKKSVTLKFKNIYGPISGSFLKTENLLYQLNILYFIYMIMRMELDKWKNRWIYIR